MLIRGHLVPLPGGCAASWTTGEHDIIHSLTGSKQRKMIHVDGRLTCQINYQQTKRLEHRISTMLLLVCRAFCMAMSGPRPGGWGGDCKTAGEQGACSESVNHSVIQQLCLPDVSSSTRTEPSSNSSYEIKKGKPSVSRQPSLHFRSFFWAATFSFQYFPSL